MTETDIQSDAVSDDLLLPQHFTELEETITFLSSYFAHLQTSQPDNSIQDTSTLLPHIESFIWSSEEETQSITAAFTFLGSLPAEDISSSKTLMELFNSPTFYYSVFRFKATSIIYSLVSLFFLPSSTVKDDRKFPLKSVLSLLISNKLDPLEGDILFDSLSMVLLREPTFSTHIWMLITELQSDFFSKQIVNGITSNEDLSHHEMNLFRFYSTLSSCRTLSNLRPLLTYSSDLFLYSLGAPDQSSPEQIFLPIEVIHSVTSLLSPLDPNSGTLPLETGPLCRGFNEFHDLCRSYSPLSFPTRKQRQYIPQTHDVLKLLLTHLNQQSDKTIFSHRALTFIQQFLISEADLQVNKLPQQSTLFKAIESYLFELFVSLTSKIPTHTETHDFDASSLKLTTLSDFHTFLSRHLSETDETIPSLSLDSPTISLFLSTIPIFDFFQRKLIGANRSILRSYFRPETLSTNNILTWITYLLSHHKDRIYLFPSILLFLLFCVYEVDAGPMMTQINSLISTAFTTLLDFMKDNLIHPQLLSSIIILFSFISAAAKCTLSETQPILIPFLTAFFLLSPQHSQDSPPIPITSSRFGFLATILRQRLSSVESLLDASDILSREFTLTPFLPSSTSVDWTKPYLPQLQNTAKSFSSHLLSNDEHTLTPRSPSSFLSSSSTSVLRSGIHLLHAAAQSVVTLPPQSDSNAQQFREMLVRFSTHQPLTDVLFQSLLIPLDLKTPTPSQVSLSHQQSLELLSFVDILSNQSGNPTNSYRLIHFSVNVFVTYASFLDLFTIDQIASNYAQDVRVHLDSLSHLLFTFFSPQSNAGTFFSKFLSGQTNYTAFHLDPSLHALFMKAMTVLINSFNCFVSKTGKSELLSENFPTGIIPQFFSSLLHVIPIANMIRQEDVSALSFTTAVLNDLQGESWYISTNVADCLIEWLFSPFFSHAEIESRSIDDLLSSLDVNIVRSRLFMSVLQLVQSTIFTKPSSVTLPSLISFIKKKGLTILAFLVKSVFSFLSSTAPQDDESKQLQKTLIVAVLDFLFQLHPSNYPIDPNHPEANQKSQVLRHEIALFILSIASIFLPLKHDPIQSKDDPFTVPDGLHVIASVRQLAGAVQQDQQGFDPTDTSIQSSYSTSAFTANSPCNLEFCADILPKTKPVPAKQDDLTQIAIDTLVSLEIPRARAALAIAAVGTGGSQEELIQRAMDWILSQPEEQNDNEDDPAFETLVSFQIPEDRAKEALKAIGREGSLDNRVNRAMEYLLEHSPEEQPEQTQCETPTPAPKTEHLQLIPPVKLQKQVYEWFTTPSRDVVEKFPIAYSSPFDPQAITQELCTSVILRILNSSNHKTQYLVVLPLIRVGIVPDLPKLFTLISQHAVSLSKSDTDFLSDDSTSAGQLYRALHVLSFMATEKSVQLAHLNTEEGGSFPPFSTFSDIFRDIGVNTVQYLTQWLKTTKDISADAFLTVTDHTDLVCVACDLISNIIKPVISATNEAILVKSVVDSDSRKALITCSTQLMDKLKAIFATFESIPEYSTLKPTSIVKPQCLIALFNMLTLLTNLTLQQSSEEEEHTATSFASLRETLFGLDPYLSPITHGSLTHLLTHLTLTQSSLRTLIRMEIRRLLQLTSSMPNGHVSKDAPFISFVVDGTSILEVPPLIPKKLTLSTILELSSSAFVAYPSVFMDELFKTCVFTVQCESLEEALQHMSPSAIFLHQKPDANDPPSNEITKYHVILALRHCLFALVSNSASVPQPTTHATTGKVGDILTEIQEFFNQPALTEAVTQSLLNVQKEQSHSQLYLELLTNLASTHPTIVHSFFSSLSDSSHNFSLFFIHLLRLFPAEFESLYDPSQVLIRFLHTVCQVQTPFSLKLINIVQNELNQLVETLDNTEHNLIYIRSLLIFLRAIIVVPLDANPIRPQNGVLTQPFDIQKQVPFSSANLAVCAHIYPQHISNQPVINPFHANLITITKKIKEDQFIKSEMDELLKQITAGLFNISNTLDAVHSLQYPCQETPSCSSFEDYLTHFTNRCSHGALVDNFFVDALSFVDRFHPSQKEHLTNLSFLPPSHSTFEISYTDVTRPHLTPSLTALHPTPSRAFQLLSCRPALAHSFSMNESLILHVVDPLPLSSIEPDASPDSPTPVPDDVASVENPPQPSRLQQEPIPYRIAAINHRGEDYHTDPYFQAHQFLHRQFAVLPKKASADDISIRSVLRSSSVSRYNQTVRNLTTEGFLVSSEAYLHLKQYAIRAYNRQRTLVFDRFRQISNRETTTTFKKSLQTLFGTYHSTLISSGLVIQQESELDDYYQRCSSVLYGCTFSPPKDSIPANSRKKTPLNSTAASQFLFNCYPVLNDNLIASTSLRSSPALRSTMKMTNVLFGDLCLGIILSHFVDLCLTNRREQQKREEAQSKVNEEEQPQPSPQSSDSMPNQEEDPLNRPISPSFLAALPEDLRQEAIAQHEEEIRRRRQQRGLDLATQQQPQIPPENEIMMMLLPLPQELRGEIYLQLGDAQLASLPADMRQEAEQVRERMVSQYTREDNGRDQEDDRQHRREGDLAMSGVLISDLDLNAEGYRSNDLFGDFARREQQLQREQQGNQNTPHEPHIVQEQDPFLDLFRTLVPSTTTRESSTRHNAQRQDEILYESIRNGTGMTFEPLGFGATRSRTRTPAKPTTKLNPKSKEEDYLLTFVKFVEERRQTYRFLSHHITAHHRTLMDVDINVTNETIPDDLLEAHSAFSVAVIDNLFQPQYVTVGFLQLIVGALRLHIRETSSSQVDNFIACHLLNLPTGEGSNGIMEEDILSVLYDLCQKSQSFSQHLISNEYVLKSLLDLLSSPSRILNKDSMNLILGILSHCSQFSSLITSFGPSSPYSSPLIPLVDGPLHSDVSVVLPFSQRVRLHLPSSLTQTYIPLQPLFQSFTDTMFSLFVESSIHSHPHFSSIHMSKLLSSFLSTFSKQDSLNFLFTILQNILTQIHKLVSETENSFKALSHHLQWAPLIIASYPLLHEYCDSSPDSYSVLPFPLDSVHSRSTVRSSIYIPDEYLQPLVSMMKHELLTTHEEKATVSFVKRAPPSDVSFPYSVSFTHLDKMTKTPSIHMNDEDIHLPFLMQSLPALNNPQFQSAIDRMKDGVLLKTILKNKHQTPSDLLFIMTSLLTTDQQTLMFTPTKLASFLSRVEAADRNRLRNDMAERFYLPMKVLNIDSAYLSSSSSKEVKKKEDKLSTEAVDLTTSTLNLLPDSPEANVILSMSATNVIHDGSHPSSPAQTEQQLNDLEERLTQFFASSLPSLFPLSPTGDVLASIQSHRPTFTPFSISQQRQRIEELRSVFKTDNPMDSAGSTLPPPLSGSIAAQVMNYIDDHGFSQLQYIKRLESQLREQEKSKSIPPTSSTPELPFFFTAPVTIMELASLGVQLINTYFFSELRQSSIDHSKAKTKHQTKITRDRLQPSFQQIYDQFLEYIPVNTWDGFIQQRDMLVFHFTQLLSSEMQQLNVSLDSLLSQIDFLSSNRLMKSMSQQELMQIFADMMRQTDRIGHDFRPLSFRQLRRTLGENDDEDEDEESYHEEQEYDDDSESRGDLFHQFLTEMLRSNGHLGDDDAFLVDNAMDFDEQEPMLHPNQDEQTPTFSGFVIREFGRRAAAQPTGRISPMGQATAQQSSLIPQNAGQGPLFFNQIETTSLVGEHSRSGLSSPKVSVRDKQKNEYILRIAHDIRRFYTSSSDKSVNPLSVYGITQTEFKRIMETQCLIDLTPLLPEIQHARKERIGSRELSQVSMMLSSFSAATLPLIYPLLYSYSQLLFLSTHRFTPMDIMSQSIQCVYGHTIQPLIPKLSKPLQVVKPNQTPNMQLQYHHTQIHPLHQLGQSHSKIINSMLATNPNLALSTTSLLTPFVHSPQSFSFSTKKDLFMFGLRKHVESIEGRHSTLEISVGRPNFFNQAYSLLAHIPGSELLTRPLRVRFEGEQGVDAGGLRREFFLLLSKHMFDPSYALFLPTLNPYTFQPDPRSSINGTIHLSYFKFIGKMVAKAIFDHELLDAYFTRSFYKHILQCPLVFSDLEGVDPQMYRSLQIIMTEGCDEIGLTFEAPMELFGRIQTVELKPGGSQIAVTDENKKEYCMRMTEARMTRNIREQIDAFLSGFYEVIPLSLITIFDPNELELLISGMPTISAQFLKTHTIYQGYTEESEQIHWFWEDVEGMTEEQRARLVQFITGTSKVPFMQEREDRNEERWRIEISRIGHTGQLPTAHTCFNQLELPFYETHEELSQKLLIAINEGAEGFGFV
ncbi:putative E3 ubiquitin-protein ligase UPL1 [Blattamonas nauphoetae]|uniref:HECT-type E3 ubiquitin transferase n=1 Tax=Blattamonas nauphoetae TaxID=2049346 RepID=A0ABQ9WTH1_9EUKA|nr:putative E3 ubiquitin-protein ligase UPL1 [Blattamonas nauphoetae]